MSVSVFVSIAQFLLLSSISFAMLLLLLCFMLPLLSCSIEVMLLSLSSTVVGIVEDESAATEVAAAAEAEVAKDSIPSTCESAPRSREGERGEAIALG